MVQRKAVLTVNAWFDTMNSRTPFNAVPHRCGLGKHEDMQLQALDEMQNLVESMAFCDKERRTLLPFQKAILISIQSTKEIFLKLKQQLPITYILTHRFNQDYLENKFSRIQEVEGDVTHPGPVQAINRLRSLELISNVAKLVSNPVVQMEDYAVTPGIELTI